MEKCCVFCATTHARHNVRGVVLSSSTSALKARFSTANWWFLTSISFVIACSSVNWTENCCIVRIFACEWKVKRQHWLSELFLPPGLTYHRHEFTMYSMFFLVWNILWRHNSKSFWDNWILKKILERYWKCILWCVIHRTFSQKSEPFVGWQNIDQNQLKLSFFIASCWIDILWMALISKRIELLIPDWSQIKAYLQWF